MLTLFPMAGIHLGFHLNLVGDLQCSLELKQDMHVGIAYQNSFSTNQWWYCT